MLSEKERLLRIHFGHSSSSFHSEKSPLLRSSSHIQKEDQRGSLSRNASFIRSPCKLIDTEEEVLKFFNKTGNVQGELNETIRKVNLVVEQLLKRGSNLNTIHTKCETLERTTNLFKRQANEHVELTKCWYKSIASKYYCWLIIGAIPILALVFIFYRYYFTTHN
ncbi:hypothetical protein HMI54_008060 [Coelomomyces lativittatus]|nr:hypothetical protein HMI54_008060 [Coelomomyces lativittatus]KAJ1503542.1 hypothetical protein HMI55_002416 [Coelomomyces lativittatus]KAJ1513618.1 hypothetical protein HMI56_002094 [Coelomomyces lativittatus]